MASTSAAAACLISSKLSQSWLHCARILRDGFALDLHAQIEFSCKLWRPERPVGVAADKCKPEKSAGRLVLRAF